MGKTSCGMTRLRSHWTPSELRKNTHKSNWIRQLVDAGLRPEIEILETPTSAELLSEAEKFWIAYWRSIGARLTNLSDGGEGHEGARHNAEARAKISAAQLGKKASAATRLKMSKAHLGRKASAVSRANMSKGRQGMKFSASHRLTMSRVQGGLPIRVTDASGAVTVCDTLNSAARFAGVHRGNLNQCLRGLRKSTGGFTFAKVL